MYDRITNHQQQQDKIKKKQEMDELDRHINDRIRQSSSSRDGGAMLAAIIILAIIALFALAWTLNF